MSLFWQILFWSGVALLAYTYFGYPLFLRVLTAGRRQPVPPEQPSESLPHVQVLLVVRNEAERIATRINNLLDTSYPADRLRLLVVSDGSDDETVSLVGALHDSRIGVIALPDSRGKAAGLSAGLAAANADILVFTDARQSFQPDTIPNLVRHFANPTVGAVSGALVVRKDTTDSVGEGVDTYWRLEKWIREREAAWDSSIGCTGAIYAARRELLSPMPPDTILDDVVFPMGVATQGFRILFDPEAIAIDPQGFSAAKEGGRKERTLAGNFQMLFRHPQWLLPWRNRLWWQLLSHKYLRVLAPLFLLLVLLANLCLLGESLYLVTLVGQMAFYLAAVVGMHAGSRQMPAPIRYPTALVFLNVCVVRGLFRFLRGDYSRGWQKQRT
jgi:cellulose synthase/poly-beta-1,6-N-acetylglucosamine synthase-like glycosyltransferase